MIWDIANQSVRIENRIVASVVQNRKNVITGVMTWIATNMLENAQII